MSQSPATPAGKQGIHSEPNVTFSANEKVTATSKIKQASLYEPSPASTYGETVGSSAPATPQDVASHSKSALFLHLKLPARVLFFPPWRLTCSLSPQHGFLHHLKKQWACILALHSIEPLSSSSLPSTVLIPPYTRGPSCFIAPHPSCHHAVTLSLVASHLGPLSPIWS